MAGHGGHHLYHHVAAMRPNLPVSSADPVTPGQAQYFHGPSQFNAFAQSRPMQQPMVQGVPVLDQMYQQSPLSPPYNIPDQQNIQVSSVGQAQGGVEAPINPNWNGGSFDSNDQSLFNFDLASLNFGNHYGALEFGMLGHMATGADGASPSDSATQISGGGQQVPAGHYPMPLGSFGESPTQPYAYSDPAYSEWPTGQNVYGQQFNQLSSTPHAFAIETNNANIISPAPSSSPQLGVSTKLEDSPTASHRGPALPPTPNSTHMSLSHMSATKRNQAIHETPFNRASLHARAQGHETSRKRLRDPASIYEQDLAPYPYTEAFHSLIDYLKKRFAGAPHILQAIAKNLADIRPSFIIVTKTLIDEDLRLMERMLQRTLLEYEHFIEDVGTPTIVARRTGEVVAVGKEFSVLTGWDSEILLGRAPNHNINRGAGLRSGSAPATGRNSPINDTAKNPKPVFLAELFDDDGVVDFYENFHRLAFEDSRGSVMGRVKLLKYQTEEDIVTQKLRPENAPGSGSLNPAYGQGTRQRNGVPRQLPQDLKRNGIAHESEMGQRLGDRDGKVDCAICWSVKRDGFDMPMLIILNVSFTSDCLLSFAY